MDSLRSRVSSFLDVKLLSFDTKSQLPVPKLLPAVFLSTLVLLIVRRIIRGRSRLPPGPANLPIIGAFLSLGTELHKVFSTLSKKYGPVMYLRLGTLPVVVISSADVAEELLREKDEEFASRAHDTILYSNAKYFGFDSSNIVFSAYTPTVKQIRKVCTTELLATSKVSNSMRIRFEEQGEMIRDISETSKDGTPFFVGEVVHTMTMNVVCRMLFKKRYYGKSVQTTKELQEFQKLMIDMQNTAGKLNVTDLLPYLRWLDPQGLTAEFRMLGEKQRKVMRQLLDDHKTSRKENPNKVLEPENMDFVDILLSLTGANKLSDDSIMAATNDMLIGATDTSANTVEWTLIELVRHPEIQDKLHEEMDRVVGKGRAMVEADLPNLPYLEAVIKEVFRLYPPVPLLVPRTNSTETTLGSYKIPRKSSVFVNIYAISRDPKVWDRPEEFTPERFFNSSISIVGNNYKYLPFGAGRRKCVGINLAQVMVGRTIGCLVHAFDFHPPTGMKPFDISTEDKYGMVLRPKHSLQVVAVPRLPSLEVYYSLPQEI